MDWLCVELDAHENLPGAFCNTTSHPERSLDEVVAFARQWNELKGEQPDVQILKSNLRSSGRGPAWLLPVGASTAPLNAVVRAHGRTANVAF